MFLKYQRWDTWGRKQPRSYPQAAPKVGVRVGTAVTDHHKQIKAMLASNSDVIVRLGMLAVEPTFLP